LGPIFCSFIASAVARPNALLTGISWAQLGGRTLRSRPNGLSRAGLNGKISGTKTSPKKKRGVT